MKPIRHRGYVISALTGMLLSLITCGSGLAKTANESPPASIPTGIEAFEQSALCQKYKCWLKTVEPLHFQGVIEYYFYNYMIVDDQGQADEAGTKVLRSQVGIRMLVDNPYTEPPAMNYPTLIIRWFPVKHKKDIDLDIVEDICQSVIKKYCPDLVANGERFLKNMSLIKHEDTDEWNLGEGFIAKYGLFSGTNTQRYPQFTFMLTHSPVLHNEALNK